MSRNELQEKIKCPIYIIDDDEFPPISFVSFLRPCCQETHQPTPKDDNEMNCTTQRNPDPKELRRLKRSYLHERSKTIGHIACYESKCRFTQHQNILPSNSSQTQRLGLNHTLLQKVTKVGLRCDIQTKKKIGMINSYPIETKSMTRLLARQLANNGEEYYPIESKSTRRSSIHKRSSSFGSLPDMNDELEDAKNLITVDSILQIANGWIEPMNHSSTKNQQKRGQHNPLKSIFQAIIPTKDQHEAKISDIVECSHGSKNVLSRNAHKNGELSCVSNFAKLA